MDGDFVIIPKMKELRLRVNGHVDIAVLIFENEEICLHLFNIYNRKMPVEFFQEYFNATFRSLEIYVQKFFGKDDEELVFLGSNFRVSYSYPVNYALQYLDIAVGIKIHVEDIANESNTSPSVLIRKFQKEMGITPLQYLMYKLCQETLGGDGRCFCCNPVRFFP